MSDFEQWYADNKDRLHLTDRIAAQNVWQAAKQSMHVHLNPAFYAPFGKVDGEWVPIPDYSGISESEVKGKVLRKAFDQGFKGTADERLVELGWHIFPVSVQQSIQGEAVAMHLACPVCCKEHVDEGEWASRKHKTHQCQHCGHEWRPFEFPTVGVTSDSAARIDEKDAEIARLQKELEEARKQLKYCADDYAYIPTQILDCTAGLTDWIRGRSEVIQNAIRQIDASLNIKGGAE